MKIALVTKHLDLPVGFGTYATQLLEALAEVGVDHEFMVYTPHAPKRSDWPDNFTVRDFEVPQVRSKLARWEHFTVARTIKQDNVDLVHYFHTGAPVPPVRRPVITNVLDAIGWAMPGYKPPLPYNVLARRDIFISNHLITISEAAKADINRLLGISLGKISVTPLAGPTIDAKPGRTKPYFLFVGGSEKRKNLPLVLQAFSEGAFTDYRLKIIGATDRTPIADDRSQLEQLLTAEAKPRVDWLGRVDNAQLAALYREATALVFPSRYEGFGLPVLEAMAHHTPVIAGNVSSIPEVAGNSALLIDPDNVTELKEAMGSLVTNTKLRQDLVARGLKTAKQYTWQKTAQATLAVYEQVAARATR